MMRELQTPHKDHARPSPKLSSARLSKNTVSKKSLTAAFSSISEDPRLHQSPDSTPVSVISEIGFLNRDADVITESLMNLKDPSLEAEVVASLLKEARIQVANSVVVDDKSKKLLDALVEIVPEERDQIAELLSAKAKILVVCSFLWIIATAVFLMFSSGARSTFRGPLPT